MKDLEKALQNIQVTPDNNWYSSTLEKIINESSKKEPNLFINYLTMTKVRLAFLAVFAVTLLGVVGVVLGISLLKGNQSGIQIIALSEQEKRELFQNIVANNPQGVLSVNNKSASTAALNAASSYIAAESDSAVSADPMPSRMIGIAPFPVSDKILVSEYKSEKGPITCSYSGYNNTALQDIYANMTSVSASYQSSDGRYYNKYENRYKGTLIAANINKSSNSFSEGYDYKGGEFAVYSKYEYDEQIVQNSTTGSSGAAESIEPDMPTSDADVPSTTDLSIDEYIKQYFGTTANVLGKTTENGRDYFIIELENFNYCNDSWLNSNQTVETPNFWEGENYPETPAPTIDANNRIVIRQWIDATSYEMYKVEDYLQAVSAENLINRMTYTNTEVEPTEQNINDYFTFNYTTDIRDSSLYTTNVDTGVTYDPVAEVDKTFNSFAQNDVSVISTTNPDLTLNYIYYTQPVDTSVQTLMYIPEYYKERSFFPAGEIGDILFEGENSSAESYKMLGIGFTDENAPVGNISFSNRNTSEAPDKSKYATFSIYNSSVDDMKIVNANLYTPAVERNIADVTLNFGGEQIQAKAYNYKINNQIYYSSDPAVSFREDLVAPTENVCQGDECITDGHVVIFEFGGMKYSMVLNAGSMNNAPFTTELFDSYQFNLVRPGSTGFDSLKNDYIDYLNTFSSPAEAEKLLM